MNKKQVYYGTLFIRKNGKNKIIISDENIKNIFVLLNSENGGISITSS